MRHSRIVDSGEQRARRRACGWRWGQGKVRLLHLHAEEVRLRLWGSLKLYKHFFVMSWHYKQLQLVLEMQALSVAA